VRTNFSAERTAEESVHCQNEIFESSNPIGIIIHFPVMKFQNNFLENFHKIYLI